MKKQTAKPIRRAAGLQIRASLEPRPDAGANPATDIFRAVKDEENAAQAKNSEFAERRSDSTETAKQNSAEREVTNESEQTKLMAVESDVARGSSPVEFGGGQMRVVSLQPPKPRKFAKKPQKNLRVVTSSQEVSQIPTLFERTKAEELYELLYQLTLGADEPVNSVRVRRSDLMANTNINTRLTLDLNLKRLEENKLIKIDSRPGEQDGNIYTVFPLPEASGKR